MRVAVDTGALSPAAGRLTAIGDEIAGVRQGLDRAGAAGHAADSPEFADALGAFTQSWSGALMMMSVGAQGLGENLAASAHAYDVTDRSQFP
jgi:hypothetical protein